jgi:hypothetical protein
LENQHSAAVVSFVVAGHNSDAGTSFVVKTALVVGSFAKEGLGIGTEHCTVIAAVTNSESYENWLENDADFHVDFASCCAELTYGSWSAVKGRHCNRRDVEDSSVEET